MYSLLDYIIGWIERFITFTNIRDDLEDNGVHSSAASDDDVFRYVKTLIRVYDLMIVILFLLCFTLLVMLIKFGLN